MISGFAWCRTYNATHSVDDAGLTCLWVPIGQHVKYSTPSFRIDARFGMTVDGTSDSRHQILGRVHPITRTQCLGELLQTNLPYFWKSGFSAHQ